MSIDRASPVAMYFQLAAALQGRIVHSGLKIGDQLPTVRDLIKEYGVSLPVVRQALNLLQQDGIITIEQGKGTFIAQMPKPKPNSGAGSVLFLSISRPSTDPFFAHVLAGFERFAARDDLSVLFGQSSGDPQQALTVIRNRGAAGVVLSGDVPPALVTALISAGTPFVCAGIPLQPEAPSGISWVANDDFTGAYQAVQHLLAMGHKRIGCVGGNLGVHYWRQRHAGYLQALDHAGITSDPLLHAIVAGDDSDFGAVAFGTILSQATPPTAVFACNDRLARGGYRVARERGLRIPEDLSIVGFDDLAFATEMHPALTTIHAEMEVLGETAYRLLAEILAGGAPRHVTLPVRLVPRASVATQR